MSDLSIDFETHSEVDLKKEGGYRYASDPSTGVYTMSWAFDDEPVQCWVYGGSPFPKRVEDHIEAGGIINAWNAQFERLIFEYVLCNDIFMLPVPTIEQFHCTAARARAHGLPGKLADAAKALNAAIRKMPEGTRLIREYCAKNVPWLAIPQADRDLMEQYCNIDVDTERGLGKMLRPLSDKEWREFHLTERINDRGVPVDVPFVDKAVGMADAIRDASDRLALVVTQGAVKTTRERKTRDEWVLPRLSEDEKDILRSTPEDAAVHKFSFEQSRRDALLSRPDLDNRVRSYLNAVDAGGGATLRKYAGIQSRQIEGRVHGALMFNGAGQTGRFSSTGLQLHNLSRETVAAPEEAIRRVVEDGEVLDHDSLKKLIRSTISSPGGLTWFDWSNIEGRVAPWLEGSELGKAKLQMYIDRIDPYLVNAHKTFRVPMSEVTPEQRAAGKVQELALQFLGGVGALRVMALNYGITLDEDTALHMRNVWRTSNPWAKALGDALTRAAIRAMQRPEQWQTAGRLRFISSRGWLWMQLPSGRFLAYHRPRIETVLTPWEEEISAVTCVWGAGKPEAGAPWPRRQMHGGIWIENATQATAADILREAVVRVDDSGLDIVLHVHDEILVEGLHKDKLASVMLVPPTWSTGLPIEGAGGSGVRYGK